MAVCFKKISSLFKTGCQSKAVLVVTMERIKRLFSGFIDCISNRKNKNSLQEKISALESLLKEKEREIAYTSLLDSTIRHDLKNNILALSTYLELASKSNNFEDVKKFVSKAEHIMKKNKECVVAWKDYGEQEKSWYDIDDIFKYIESYSSPEIKIFGKNYVGNVKVYSSSLASRMFYNLVDNTKRHGVRATTIKVMCYFEGDDLVFMYEDDGIGIPLEDKERIFKKGFGKNSGLGLFFAREILGITGIAISEEGEYGNGACFKIVVPKNAYKKT